MTGFLLIMKLVNNFFQTSFSLAVVMKKYFFLVFIFSFAIVPFFAQASAYRVYFRYDRNTGFLTFDESNGSPVQFERNLDVDTLEFINSESQGPFVIVFLFGTGEEIARKNFDPSLGNGIFVLDAPYFSFAKSIEIYRSGSNTPILLYDLSRFMTCNKNGICEYEKGENFDTCLPDCVGTTVNFSDETKKLLKQNHDMIRDPKTGGVVLHGIQVAPVAASSGTASTSTATNRILLILGAVAILLISAGVFAILRLRTRNKKYGL